MSDIESLSTQALSDIASAQTPDALESLRVALLGKSGTVTAQLKQLGPLPGDFDPSNLKSAVLTDPFNIKIRVIERAAAGTDPGWGVTIRNYALDFLGADAHPLMQKLRGRACWYNGDVAVDLPYPPTDGLHTIFLEAGFEWREPGCSMCLAMNPDKLKPQERCASTSNRNFEGRQGFKGRTHLVSPAMAAAAAIAGHFVDIREWK